MGGGAKEYNMLWVRFNLSDLCSYYWREKIAILNHKPKICLLFRSRPPSSQSTTQVTISQPVRIQGQPVRIQGQVRLQGNQVSLIKTATSQVQSQAKAPGQMQVVRIVRPKFVSINLIASNTIK